MGISLNFQGYVHNYRQYLHTMSLSTNKLHSDFVAPIHTGSQWQRERQIIEVHSEDTTFREAVGAVLYFKMIVLMLAE